MSNAAALPAASLALLNGLRITEVMYAPTGGSAYEFVELQNIGSAALDLSGVRFTEGISYTFAAGTALAPGAFVVVAKDRTSFLTRYPTAEAVLAAGSFSGSLDNSGETLTLTLPLPWELNILSFRYEPGWYATTAGGGYSLVTADQVKTAAGDWDEASTWSASPQVNGTPGSDGMPAVTSALTATGVAGDAFSYQITATKSPTAFGASGLPAGLSVNAATGLISGTPTATGTANVTLTVTNAGGSSSAVLVLTIAASGPLDHFMWDTVPASAQAGKAFTVTLTARDSANRLVPDYSGTVTLSAASSGNSTGGGGGAPVVITEATDGSEDQFELQNVTGAVVDTTGWFVRIGEGAASVTNMNTVTYTLPNSLAAGALLRVSETNGTGRSYFGASIDWSSSAGAGSRGWIMLFNASGILQDFLAMGWTAADLANLSVTINGSSVNPVSLGQWTGAGVAATTANDNWARTANTDTNTAADFTNSTTGTFGTTNTGLVLPWVTSTPVTITPASAVLSGGTFTGSLTAAAAADNVTLTATSSGKSVTSAAFNISAAAVITDTDNDGLPDDWETANGFDSNSALDAALDSDGDGQSSLAEYLAGTDPNSASSVLAITSLTKNAAGDLEITFSAVGGKTYRLSTSTDLTNWSAQEPTFSASSSGPHTFEVSVDDGTRLYFRVSVVP
jgi:hypothetical protein